MNGYYYLILICIQILHIRSPIPNWDISKQSNILTSYLEMYYTLYEKTAYNIKVILKKKMSISDGHITTQNYLYAYDSSSNQLGERQVDFEDIDSHYTDKLGYRILICPKGKYHPYDFYGQNHIDPPSNFEDKGGWDLRCYDHGTTYFYLFYLLNNGKNIYFKYTEGIKDRSNFANTYIYDYILQYGSNDETEYYFCVLRYDSSNIVLRPEALKTNMGGKDVNQISKGDTKIIITAKNKVQGYFNSDKYFFYFTYNDASDFESGYSTNAISFNNDNDYKNSVSNPGVVKKTDSPLTFADNVEIKSMNFIPGTKYAYYKIYSVNKNKNYFGLLDVTQSKILYNFEVEFNTFIPASTSSTVIMLGITDTDVYQIYIAKDSENNFINECSGTNLILDPDGNKCQDNCDEGKIKLMPGGYCINKTACDLNIYELNTGETECGLCKYINSDSDLQYKFINTRGCISITSLPTNAEYYNEKSKLLQCKNNHHLDNGECVPDFCFERCKNCSSASNNITDQKCLSCNTGFTLDEDSGNCNEPLEEIPPTTIYTPPSTMIKLPTTIAKPPTTIITIITKTTPKIECPDEKCLTCNEASNGLNLCLTCNEANGYKKVNYTIIYTGFLDCIKENDPKFRNYYFNETLDEYRPCYKTCKRCLKPGNAAEQNCLECESGYMLRPGNNPYNNCVVYSEFYYMSAYNQYKSLNIYQCPEEAKYYIKEQKSCIDDCKKDSKYKYLYNGNCLSECPSGTNNNNYICVTDSSKCILGKNEIYLAENDNLEIIGTLVKSYISEFTYTNHYISLYENNNYSIMIYKDSNCIKALSLEMPEVDFQSCYRKVQQEYGITEDLIIVIVDRKKLSNPLTYYSFYHPKSGLKLNAETICKDETIVVVESLFSVLDKNDSFYETQTSLTSQNINIFDINDPFYTDICYDFDNPLKKDIPLNDRIKDIYPNATLCDEGCQYKGINLTDMTSRCDCKFNDIANNNLVKDNEILDSAFGSVFDMINSSNILVFKCFKNMFTHFARSIGAWISLVSICGHIGMTITFFLLSAPAVNNYIFSLTYNYISYLKNFGTSNPPKRTLGNEKKSEILISSINQLDQENKSQNKKDNLNDVIIPKKENNGNFIIYYQNNENNQNIKISEINNFDTEDNLKESNKKNNVLDEEKYDKKFFEEYMSTSLDDMEFDDAVAKDQRKYCEHMAENLKEDQIIANTFIAEDPLKPRTIKIIIFILNIMLYFVINGLFFSEEVISELYNIDEDEENFFSFFPRSIERIIYCSIVGIIISMLTSFFFIDEKRIKGIFKRGKDNKDDLKKNIVELKNDLKKRYIAFISVVSVILIISTFYLLCFNYVYPYSQIEWIKSSVTIVIIMQILSTLKCILETSLRYLSYKCNSEKLYKFSKILD